MFSFWFAITLSSLIVLMLGSFYTVLVLFSSKLAKDYNGSLAYQELVEL
ncbi:hypothetical protein HTVC112P_gp41 [Pelagibacter phage HTVC112P]|nr:hypothetical protein HTVC112P_gp41 [Pelagibacter phage HTVC112P]